jgi:hypothetical protein
VGERGRIEGVRSISFPVFGIFKGFGGTFIHFWAGGQELFWKTNPQKRVVFFNQSQVFGLILGWAG